MNLNVEHDAALLARLSGAETSGCDSIIVRHGAASDVLAASHAGNPLGSDWLFDLESPSRCLVAWSGSLAASLFERDPRTWLKPGKQAFARFCDDVAPQLQSHQRRICFHPHSRHVLNDAPSCLTFLRDRKAQPFDIALAPASMLEPSMLDHVEEHLQRQFECLGSHCAMVLLSDVRVISNANDDSHCHAVPLGEGALPRDVLRQLLRTHVPETTPIVIDGRAGGDAINRQIAWLIE